MLGLYLHPNASVNTLRYTQAGKLTYTEPAVYTKVLFIESAENLEL